MNIINYDYIGATGIYPFEEELIILDNKIDLTSNILNSNIYNTSNDLQNQINFTDSLINTKITSDFIPEILNLINVSNTYIYNNNNIYGEIRFVIKYNNENENYYVKIGKDGKLYLWISYNILKPEIASGWYEVSDILADYFFNLAIINIALTGIGADLGYLQGQINAITLQIKAIVALTGVHTTQINELIALQPQSLVNPILNSSLLNAKQISDEIIARGINSVSRLGTGISSLLGLGGFGFLTYASVGTYGYFSQLAEERQEKKERLLNIYGSLLVDSNLSKLDIIDSNSLINSNNTVKTNLFNEIYSNLSIINNDEIIYKKAMINSLGFVNSNTITTQYIPNINTSNFTINNININDIITSNNQWINNGIDIAYNIGSVGIGINTPTQKLEVAGNIKTQQLYINNPNSTASIFFSPTPSIYSIFSKKVPWGMYFAEDFNTTTNILPNYISNGRDATTTGTITKTTANGNGATGNITYISGGTGATMAFPTGSIPTNFTILSLTRYTGTAKQRILQAQGVNFIHGHHSGHKNVCYYNKWITLDNNTTNLTDWLCCIGKNGGSVPNNIICDGIGKGIDIGGTGNSSLRINSGSVASQTSDWALSCVMIWDTHLTDEEMFDLNTIINNYKTDGISIKSLLSAINDDECVIESRVYGGTEKTELLVFKGNDPTGTNGADRIRLRSANIAFDTYSTTTTDRNTENIRMLINQDGNVGIGTITPNYKLEVAGTIKTDALIINDLNFNDIIYNTSNGINNNLISTSNTINNSLISTNTTLSNLNNNFILFDEVFTANLDNNYCKKSTFLIQTNNLINYQSINYYSYTIDLTKYIKYIQMSEFTKQARFKITASLASSVAVFEYLTECEYKIFMSQSSTIGQTGGFHCRAFGIPEDLNLTKYAPYKFIKTNNIYQLTFISAVVGAKFLITIIDEC